MSSDKFSRRFFLRGAGGVTLALPILPSLLTASEARAQAATNRRCYVHLNLLQGGPSGSNMYPADATLTDTLSYAGRNIRRGNLVGAAANGTTKVSEVLAAPSTVLTPALISKMNVLRGVDITFNVAHHDA